MHISVLLVSVFLYQYVWKWSMTALISNVFSCFNRITVPEGNEEEGGVGFIMGGRRYICSRCVLTHCQVVWSGTTRPEISFCPSLFVSHSLSFLLSFHTTFSCLTFRLPVFSQWETLHGHLIRLHFFPACPKEKDDPDNGNEHIPAVGSDQLTLTSVPDRTTD